MLEDFRGNIGDITKTVAYPKAKINDYFIISEGLFVGKYLQCIKDTNGNEPSCFLIKDIDNTILSLCQAGLEITLPDEIKNILFDNSEILENNINQTLENRGKKYGKFEDNADITQELIKVIEKAPNYSKLTNQHKEAFHMIFHKIARAVCGDPNYLDNIHDIIGYSQLLENFIKYEKK